MHSHSPSPAHISTSGIAKLTGKTVAAVSQWRKRHEDFPLPVEQKGRSILFDFNEVKRWLKAHEISVEDGVNGKKMRGKTPMDILSLYRGAISFERMPLCAAFAAVKKLGLPESEYPLEIALVAKELSATPQAGKLLDELAGRFTEGELMAAADELYYGSSRNLTHKNSDEILQKAFGAIFPKTPEKILDFASGPGKMLAPFAEAGSSLLGLDIHPSMTAFAQCRALIGKWNAEFRAQDALASEAFSAECCDAVVSAPPIGLRADNDITGVNPARWPYAVPTSRDESRWLQMAQYALKSNGIAALLMPAGILFRTVERNVIQAMIADGTIAALLKLPQGFVQGSGIESVLVVLRKSADNRAQPVFYGRVADLEEGIDGLFKALSEHLEGHTLDDNENYTQVNRLDLIGDSPLVVEHWLAEANTISGADHISRIRSSVSAAATRAKAIKLPALTSADANGTTDAKMVPLSQFPGVSRTRTAAEVSVAPRNIILEPSRVRIANEAELIAGKRSFQVLSIDESVANPWFILASIEAAIRSGGANVGQVAPMIKIDLIQVPLLTLEEQNRLGALVREAELAKRAAENSLAELSNVLKCIEDAVASGSVRIDD